MNHSDKVHTEIYREICSIQHCISCISSSKVAAVVLCLHRSVRNLQRIQNRAGRIMERL